MPRHMDAYQSSIEEMFSDPPFFAARIGVLKATFPDGHAPCRSGVVCTILRCTSKDYLVARGATCDTHGVCAETKYPLICICVRIYSLA